jgi:hypothetical protein
MRRRIYIFRFLVHQFTLYAKEERAWWIVPLLFSLALLTLAISLAQSSGLSPFIYALF